MDKTWLDRYPKAAALLQRADDVVLYTPMAPCGDAADRAPAADEVLEAVRSLEAAARELCDLIEEELDRGDW